MHKTILPIALLTLCLTPLSSSAQQLSEKEVIQHIDAAVHERSESIAKYTDQEQYSVYRNGAADPAAQETVQTVYTYTGGKQYTPISQSGSGMIRSALIDKVLAGEKEMAEVANREGVWVTSANYEMHPQLTPIDLNGHSCFVVDLKPKRKSPHLFTGKAWVDTTDYTVVRLEGIPSQSPSFFAGATSVKREYAKVDGFAMATHAEARSHSFLLGDTVLKIDYTNYKIERKPASSPTGN